MNTRKMGRLLAVALAPVLVFGATAAAGAPPIGPVYPLPGGPGAGHGGSTCLAASSAEAAMGKSAAQNGTSSSGQTWHYGGGTDPAQAGPGCPYDPAPTSVTPFDTTRFERLFWGPSVAPSLALDGTVDNAAGTTETLALDAGLSDLPGGKLVWTGSTRMTWCVPSPTCVFTTTTVPTRFELRATDLAGTPVALVDPATVEVDPSVGGLVEVTPALTNFKVNVVMLAEMPSPLAPPGTFLPAITMYNTLNHPNPPPVTPQTQMGFGGAFRYVSRAPTGTISHSTIVENQPVTFTANATDPDGSIAAYAWALGGDAVFDDGTNPTAQGTFAAGTHTVQARVTDDDGTVTTLSDTFTVVPATVPDVTKPIASLTLTASKLKPILKKGLKTATTTNEAGTIALSVAVSPKVAKKLKLKNPVGKATVPAGAAASYPVTVKLSKKAVKKLKDQRKVTFIVTATVTDAAGNVTTVVKSLKAKK